MNLEQFLGAENHVISPIPASQLHEEPGLITPKFFTAKEEHPECDPDLTPFRFCTAMWIPRH